ncbi:MAG: hypothetical protein DWQ34_08155 [Planctomycetota bacterium]|nr:MAG: hypothetical protein DWQ29_08040 [Planctomycetota bacterium]REJ94698.1 MAG: hypothetical protein DWQ34_08155 [Planctomycetota bacterium]REK31342.1 MAG: hypothetical protein DWQ41_00380 [Planctomycetota bacterium]REK39067.1 MAG: hypothetical protein DWQ45_02420 [Planctomycetota bacterium]
MKLWASENLKRFALIVALGGMGSLVTRVIAEDEPSASHPPMRALPTASQRPMEDGPSYFVDAAGGDDQNEGSEQTPWKTLRYSLRKLKPGDTLYLRGGVYYEKVSLSQSGTEDAPITIRSYPGETAIIDGGLREFFDSPETSWEPYKDGAEGEFVSTRTYDDANDRRVPYQFLPAAWEPMWSIEHERPLALGHFADSMVPLHSYRVAVDLRSENELWIGGKFEMRDTGVYCGPGLWFNRETGRIHIRLAHHTLEGLGDRAYRGETDPRKLPLIIAAGFGNDVLRVNGVQHVRIQDLILRGATGSPMIHVYGSQNVELDHLTVYGGFPGLLIDASQNIRVTHSAFRGLAAPWTSRAHMKYRGTASYQIVLRDAQPRNENIELAWCEFTDDHDFAFLRFVTNLQFHHNFVDNFNDDGLECGPKLRDHTLFIHQNRIGRCLIPITQHEIEKDESPADHDPESGVFVYRNVFDLRGGVYSGPPAESDPSGAFLNREGHLVGDHGSPIWPVMRVYHNTFLRETPVFRDYFLFGLGAQGLRDNERDVFNNIFVQMERVPGVGFAGITEPGRVREGGNLLWGVAEGPALTADPLAAFRKTPLYKKSRDVYPPGWTTQDQVADPGFVHLPSDYKAPADLRLQTDSPAVDSGITLPDAWPDPLRDSDSGAPDIGALPLGADPWSIGVDGRLSLFGDNYQQQTTDSTN